jgi:CheY-like chemotaxis protein
MIEESARQVLAETLGNETILVVEDEEVIRLMLVEVLTLQGYTVLEARQGADALALAASAAKPPELLVTDMCMPGMTGWELAKSLRAARPSLPILFISGHNDHETAQWGAMDQPVEHLYKPFSLESFLRKTRQMLDREKKSKTPP